MKYIFNNKMTTSNVSSNNLVVIFIPRVFLEHTAEFIRDVFDKMEIGKVSRVTFKRVKKQKNVWKAFVFFEIYYNSIFANRLNIYFKNNCAMTVYMNNYDGTNRYWLINRANNKQYDWLNKRSVINNPMNTFALLSYNEVVNVMNTQTEKIKELEEKIALCNMKKHTYFCYPEEKQKFESDRRNYYGEKYFDSYTEEEEEGGEETRGFMSRNYYGEKEEQQEDRESYRHIIDNSYETHSDWSEPSWFDKDEYIKEETDTLTTSKDEEYQYNNTDTQNIHDTFNKQDAK